MATEGDNHVDDGSMPALNMIDRTTQAIRSEVVPRKGSYKHAVETIKQFISDL